MKTIALLLFFGTFGFSQESKNLVRAKQILSDIPDHLIALKKSIGELNHSIEGDDALHILHHYINLRVAYAKIRNLQYEARDLAKEMRKEKNSQSEQLELFYKKSFKHVKDMCELAIKKMESLERCSKKESRPKTGLSFCPKCLVFQGQNGY